MTSQAVQVHCPFCNAAQATSSDGSYECEFCLQPFSVVDARKEETRLLDEIKAWMEQKIGASGSGGAVDASSRGFIFRERVLPSLERDVGRALEQLGGYGQFPLVEPPIRTQINANATPNPLVSYRQTILGLKGLRARLESPDVRSFAVADADQAKIQQLDRRVADVVLLSNVAAAASKASSAGYGASRKNLEALIEEVDQSLAIEGPGDPALAGFLGAIRGRYQALAELSDVCGELCDASHVDAAQVRGRLERVAGQIAQSSQAVEASNYSPADAMPTVIGMGEEQIACSLLARWVGAYESLTRRRSITFPRFVRDIDPICGGGHVPADVLAELVEGCAYVSDAMTGNATTAVVGDFTWVGAWADASRQKKSLGFFGTEEQLAGVQQFLLPVWVADLSYSVKQGSVFTSGVESRALMVVEACNPSPEKVVFLDQPSHPIAQALGHGQTLTTNQVALPRTTRSRVLPVFQQAVRSRPQYLNPQVQVRVMAFAAAAVAHLQSSKGQRQLASCLNGALPLDPAVLTQVQAAGQLFESFG